MKHVHSLRFEILEARQLLSRTHGAGAHAVRTAAVPLVLNGTLTVDNNPAVSATTLNADGSVTMSLPVAGPLGALGRVHGYWTESDDAYGDYVGPDTIRLRDAKGTFTVVFNNDNASPTHAKARGAVTYEHPQQVTGGTGAYAGASESGTIEVATSPARTQVVRLTLLTRNT